MRCVTFGEGKDAGMLCDTYGDLNARSYQAEFLWPLGADGRVPNGGGCDCSEPRTADLVKCEASINDSDLNTIAVVTYTCRGDILCNKDQIKTCCQVEKRTKVSRPFTRPTKDEILKDDEERCKKIAERRKTCGQFCTDPKYASQCAYWWDFKCGPPDETGYRQVGKF